jgi:hypothetical protein
VVLRRLLKHHQLIHSEHHSLKPESNGYRNDRAPTQRMKLIQLICPYVVSSAPHKTSIVLSNNHVQIDHFPHQSRYVPHTNATFKQRYFFDSSYYKPGGPVFLYIGGETSGESRFSNLQTGSKPRKVK